MDNPVQAFIEQKGVATLAEATNREPGAIRLWKHRRRIPRDAWPDLIEAFPGEVTIERLREFEAAA
jgi:hypothetical protein